MSVTPKNLEGLNWDQLRKLEHAVIDAQASEYQRLKAEMAEMATDFATKANNFAAKNGVKAVDVPAVVIPTNGNGQHKAVKAKGRKVAKIAIKYRDPAHPENTWTGRGRQPRWMTASGKSKDAFRIGA